MALLPFIAMMISIIYTLVHCIKRRGVPSMKHMFFNAVLVASTVGFIMQVLLPNVDILLVGKYEQSKAEMNGHVTEGQITGVGHSWEESSKFHNSLPFISDMHADTMLWTHRPSILHDTRPFGHVDVPRMRQGNAALQVFATVTKIPLTNNFDSNSNSTDIILLLGMAQWWPLNTWNSYYQRVIHQHQRLYKFSQDSSSMFRIIKSKSDIIKYYEDRQKNRQLTAGLMSVEGAHALDGKLENVDHLFDFGIRMFGLSHFTDSEFGGSAHGKEKYGLTSFGNRALKRMLDRGIIIDLAHTSPKLFDDVFEATQDRKTRIMVSHAGVRGTCDNSRNLSDDQIRKVASRNGIIGVAFFEKAVCGKSIQHVVDAIKYIKKLLGNVDHIVLGSDWDGAVRCVIDVSELPHLTYSLLKNGFSKDEIRKIMSDNSYNFLKETLPDQ